MSANNDAIRDAIGRGLDAPRPSGLFSDAITNILSALTAAGYAVEQGWQPIETAPRDGTRMLCYAPAAEDRASIVRSDFWWVRERGFAHMRPGQPYTHWRPLPAAPQEDRDEGR